jgi:hypothetical protein
MYSGIVATETALRISIYLHSAGILDKRKQHEVVLFESETTIPTTYVENHFAIAHLALLRKT